MSPHSVEGLLYEVNHAGKKGSDKHFPLSRHYADGDAFRIHNFCDMLLS